MKGTDLTATEHRLYEALRQAGGGLVTYRELLVVLFGEQANYAPADGTDLRSFIHHMRRKGVEITNVRRIGYALGSTRCPTCGQERGQ